MNIRLRVRFSRLATAALVVWAASASPVHAQTTALYLESQPGDYVGQGESHTWTDAELTFAGSANPALRDVFLTARTSNFSTFWHLRFVATEPGMQPGVYENAVRASYPSRVSPQLSIGGQGRGCNMLAGRFIVYEFVLGADDTVTSFAADFEQHCEGATAALFGAIRINSSRASLIPFDGDYPVYSLAVHAPVNGYVLGPGIDCGAGRIDCDELYPANTSVLLHAIPAAGYVFLGWAGDCVGKQDGVVAIRWRRFCAPVFNREPGDAEGESPDLSAGALFLDGRVGVLDFSAPLIQPSWEVYASLSPDSPIRSLVWPLSSVQQTSGLVQFQVDGPGGATLNLLFASPVGTALTPGTTYAYTSTVLDPASIVPVLQLNRLPSSLFCTGGGRFTVHEFTFDETTGSVISFAADFELPCGSGELVTGSLRYRSTRSSLRPFDGQYPLYALHVVPTLGGYVTATGILCGDGGRTDCDETFGTVSISPLQAVPSPGYQFVGWSGACSEGNPTTAVLVDRATRCFAVFAPTPGGGAPDDQFLGAAVLLVDSFGATPAARSLWFGGDARISAWGGESGVSATFTSVSSTATSTVFFGALSGSIEPGIYEREYATANGFSLSGCFVAGVRFQIYELTMNSFGRVLTLAADFEALCNFPTHRVVGSIRINSTRGAIVPFDGAYPIARLTIEPAINGLVVGPGIDCGPGHADCTEPFAAPATVTLQAIPLAGYRFVGWGGACQGPSMTAIAVNWLRTCTAVFNAVIPGVGAEDSRLSARAFSVESEIGDPVGQGRRHVWIDALVGASAQNRRWITMSVYSPDEDYWYIELRAPIGRELQARPYENAQSVFGATTAPGLRISSRAGSCSNSLTGRFVVHEIAFASSTSSTVTALAADFEQRCTPGGPLLRASIRFQSGRAILKPFAPSVFTPVAAPVRPDVNRDGWADLVWRHTTSGRNAVWLLNNFTANMTMGLEPSSAATVADLAWEIRAVGDMNGDGSPDLVWQHSTSGRLAVWFMSGSRLVTSNHIYNAAHSSTEPDLNWKIVAAGDMDRDGHVDLVWRHRTTGQLRLWHMDGVVQWDSVSLGTVADVNWEISSVADMNSDGMLDLVWRHYGHGGIASWFMYDALVQATVRLSDLADTSWRIAGVADMNGDGKSDLVWQNTAGGGIAVWLMDGVSTIGGRYLSPATLSDPNWRIVGVR